MVSSEITRKAIRETALPFSLPEMKQEAAGVAKDWAKAFYNSKRWIRCRDSYIAGRISTDGGVCEECRRQQGYIVHHEITLTPDNIDNPDISLNHQHMKYVCKDCHDKYEGHGVGHRKAKPLCTFDENGQPISLREIDTPPCLSSALPAGKTVGGD